MRINTITISLTFLVVLISYLYFSNPGNVVVDEHGNIDGIFNQLRKPIQGVKFWQHQAQYIRNQLDWDLSAPIRQTERDLRILEIQSSHEQFMEKMYQENPRSRPSLATQQAEALHIKADEIEQDELNHYIEKRRLERISMFNKVLLIVEKKIEVTNNSK